MNTTYFVHAAGIALGVALLAVAPVAKADVITIAQDPNAPTSNFQNPGSTATIGYTIQTNDDGTNFYVDLTATDPAALPFANLYFDTIASTPNTGSNLGFEFGQTSSDAFDPDTGTKYDLSNTGVTSLFTVDTSGDTLAAITIPNSFFLNNPLGMEFTPTPDGSLVSLHLSQSFGYSVVGGSGNFPAPAELGDATIGSPSAVPEPGSFTLLGLGAAGIMVGSLRKRFVRA